MDLSSIFNSQFSILIITFFFVAVIYASVGFGGGTSYLALLTLMGINFYVTRSTALLCNIVVVTTGSFIFYKEGKLDFKKSWPLVVSSVPLAYLGGLWPVRQEVVFILLGITLIAAAVLLWIQPEKNVSESNPKY